MTLKRKGRMESDKGSVPMKPIYVGQQKKPASKKVWYVGIFVLLIILLLKFLLPPVVESAINRSGSDEQGYSFRIENLDLAFLKMEVWVEKAEVFNHKNSHTYLEGKDLVMDFNPLN